MTKNLNHQTESQCRIHNYNSSMERETMGGGFERMMDLREDLEEKRTIFTLAFQGQGWHKFSCLSLWEDPLL